MYGLVPGPVYLVIAEIAVALVLTALWRMRRFGPLVFEPLPVVVRASETAEGHGRPGDIFVALSTSGSSANLLLAAECAHAGGLAVWASTGAMPNPLALRADWQAHPARLAEVRAQTRG